MDLKKIKINVNFADWRKKCAGCISKRSGIILCLIFFALVGYCLYLLYKHIYRPEWSETRRMEYANSKEKETVFNEEKFERAVLAEEDRKKRFEEKIENPPDIFGLKQ